MTEKTTPPKPKSAPPPAMTPDALSLALASNPRFVVIKPSGKAFIIGGQKPHN
jgi:hypothetical protein